MKPFTISTRFIEEAKACLSKPLPGFSAQKKMGPTLLDGTLLHDRSPSNACRINGVMLLFFVKKNDIRLLLTVRSSEMRKHKGEISCPGGGLDPNETPLQAAIRETEEETGVSEQEIEVLGALSDLYIPVSDNLLKPHVGFYHGEPFFKPDEREVQQILTPNFSYFLSEENVKKEQWNLHGFDLIVPCWHINNRPLWGATAMILNEFIEVMRSK